MSGTAAEIAVSIVIALLFVIGLYKAGNLPKLNESRARSLFRRYGCRVVTETYDGRTVSCVYLRGERIASLDSRSVNAHQLDERGSPIPFTSLHFTYGVHSVSDVVYYMDLTNARQ